MISVYLYQKLRISVLLVFVLSADRVLAEMPSVEQIVAPVMNELPLAVEGEWLPGAMLIGRTAPGVSVKVLDRTIVSDAHGMFVFGLGRDTGNTVVLELEAPEGVQRRSEYAVQRREYDIQRIEGVESKYVSPPKDVIARINEDARKIRRARQIHSPTPFFLDGFIWPAEGPVTGVYGSQRIFNGVPKRPHFGLDIGAPQGTHVFAPASGVVSLVHSNMYYSGGTLIVDHGHGISSTFIHLSDILVTENQHLKRGDLIAKIGATGRATGPHLDWRVNWYEQRLDPALLLPARVTDKAK